MEFPVERNQDGIPVVNGSSSSSRRTSVCSKRSRPRANSHADITNDVKRYGYFEGGQLRVIGNVSKGKEDDLQRRRLNSSESAIMARKNGLIRRRKSSLSKKFEPIVLPVLDLHHPLPNANGSHRPSALPLVLDDENEINGSYPNRSHPKQIEIPPYGQRCGYVPREIEDFGDGGAFPELHHKQYPLDMGRKDLKNCTEGSRLKSSRLSNVSMLSDRTVVVHDFRNAMNSELNSNDRNHEHRRQSHSDYDDERKSMELMISADRVDLDEMSRLKLSQNAKGDRSNSNVSSLCSEGAKSIMSSEYFRHFFDDDIGYRDRDRSEGVMEGMESMDHNENANGNGHGNANDDEWNRNGNGYRIEVPVIVIPQSERDLFKKVKPAYKHHLEMIDDDGSITYQVEQMRKRREREKQQQKMKQFYANSSHRKLSRDVGRYLRSYLFESKPLGFQINNAPEGIFITNVYDDRGSAFGKGVLKGWRIVEVNGLGEVTEMMDELRNSDGPFQIMFDTLG